MLDDRHNIVCLQGFRHPMHCRATAKAGASSKADALQTISCAYESQIPSGVPVAGPDILAPGPRVVGAWVGIKLGGCRCQGGRKMAATDK